MKIWTRTITFLFDEEAIGENAKTLMEDLDILNVWINFKRVMWKL